jgi:uncharacterized membrane protein YgdD (TMEM256/DUF423 family)
MIDDSLSRRIILFAAVSGAVGIAMGAFAAHGLETFLESRGHSAELIAKRVDQFDVAVRYHLMHSVALLALASVPFGPPASRHWVSRLFLVGLILFCGSLYALVLSNTPVLGAIAPIGAGSWILGWLCLIWVASRSSSK